MTKHRFQSRRQFLATCTAGVTLLTGCIAGPSDSTDTNRDSNPTEGGNPKLALSAHPTSKAGEIHITVEAHDNSGLNNFQLLINDIPVEERSLFGSQQYIDETTVKDGRLSPFEWNTVTGRITDTDGNVSTKEVDSYVRRYDVLEDTPFDIGAHIVPFSLQWMNSCISDNHDIGPHMERRGDVPISVENLTRWIDQMQGHGIFRLVFTWGGQPEINTWDRNFGNLDAAPLFKKMTVEPWYWIGEGVWEGDGDREVPESVKDDIVHPRLHTFRDEIIAKDNAATYDERPIFNFGNAPKLLAPYHRETVEEEWGGHEAMMRDVRQQLRRDGTDPFLVAGLAGLDGTYDDVLAEFVTPFDAVTTWQGAGAWGDDNQATWEEAYNFMKELFRSHREFTDAHDMEFIPHVFPGFDDRHNTCWGGDRLTPRSPSHLAQLFELADRCRTTDMINIATWNDWTEGSVIEPGTFRGNDFGTAYLEVVEKFQQNQ